MPNTKSAKRSLKKAKRNWLRNEIRRRLIKRVIKEYLKAIKEKDKEKAQKLLSEVYRQIDKGAKRFIHKNKAARLKLKYAKIFNFVFAKEDTK